MGMYGSDSWIHNIAEPLSHNSPAPPPQCHIELETVFRNNEEDALNTRCRVVIPKLRELSSFLRMM